MSPTSLNRAPSDSNISPESIAPIVPDSSEKVVNELCKPSHRNLIVIEESNDWESVEMIEFAKKIDIKFSRTIFVFTKFHVQIQKYSNPKEFAQYFSKKPAGTLFF